MIGVPGVGFGRGHDPVGPEKTAEMVHMAVGVVADNTPVQPTNRADAQRVAKRALDFGPRPGRIPVGVEQTGLGGEQAAGAVHVDRPSFQHQLPLEAAQAQRPGDPPRNPIVQGEAGVFPSPGVEFPIGQRHLTRAVVFDKNGAVIPAPGVIRRMIVKSDAPKVGLRPVEQSPGTRLRLARTIDAHVLEARDQGRDFGEFCRDGPEVAGPGGQPVGPGKPHGGLRLPLGRHPETECRRSSGR